MDTKRKVGHLFSLTFIMLFISYYGYSQRSVTNPHDFNLNGDWTLSERCNPCHVINEDASEESDFEVVYERDSLSKEDSVYLSSTSKLCFTCHDGAVATFTHIADGEMKIRGAGMKNHPVSVVYDLKNTRVRLFDPKTTKSGLGGTIAEDLLSNGRVECTSCHNAHFSTEKIACTSCPQVLFKHGTSDGTSSLWVDNKKSSLCLVCHKL